MYMYMYMYMRKGLEIFYVQYDTYGSRCIYIGIGQVIQHQPCTFENSSFYFHYALHFTFVVIGVKDR